MVQFKCLQINGSRYPTNDVEQEIGKFLKEIGPNAKIISSNSFGTYQGTVLVMFVNIFYEV